MSSNEADDRAASSGPDEHAGKHARSRRWRSPDEPCLNCGDPRWGRYCPSCGQRKLEVQVSVRTMLRDVLEDQLALSGALPRTLVALLFRPGHLTNEYIRGRIVSYIAPFRLYLVASVLFFLLFSFVGLAVIERSQVSIPEMEAVGEARAALDRFDRELAAMDTAAMPESARAALRGTRENLLAALNRTIADSTEAARAFAQLTGETPAAPAPPSTPGDATAAQTQESADTADAPTEESADTAAAARETGVTGSDTQQTLTPEQQRLQPWAREIRSESPFPFLDRAAQRKVQQVGHLPPREALSQVLRDYVEFAPHMVFLLLPVFALLLKVLYIRRDRYYAEHFVFALHTHAFTFLTFTLMLLVPWDWVDRILLLWMFVYMWIAMRTVYGQGVVRTTIKWWVLGWSYLWVFVIGMIGLAVVMLLAT